MAVVKRSFPAPERLDGENVSLPRVTELFSVRVFFECVKSFLWGYFCFFVTKVNSTNRSRLEESERFLIM